MLSFLQLTLIIFIFSPFSVYCRIWICVGHGIFWNNKTAALGCIHRLRRRWAPDCNSDVVSSDFWSQVQYCCSDTESAVCETLGSLFGVNLHSSVDDRFYAVVVIVLKWYLKKNTSLPLLFPAKLNSQKVCITMNIPAFFLSSWAT